MTIDYKKRKPKMAENINQKNAKSNNEWEVKRREKIEFKRKCSIIKNKKNRKIEPLSS